MMREYKPGGMAISIQWRWRAAGHIIAFRVNKSTLYIMKNNQSNIGKSLSRVVLDHLSTSVGARPFAPNSRCILLQQNEVASFLAMPQTILTSLSTTIPSYKSTTLARADSTASRRHATPSSCISPHPPCRVDFVLFREALISSIPSYMAV